MYLDAGMNTSTAVPVNADYIAGAVEEAVRLAQASSPSAPPPVRAFAKPNYRDGQGELCVPLSLHASCCHVQCAPPACCSLLTSPLTSPSLLRLALMRSCCGTALTLTNRKSLGI